MVANESSINQLETACKRAYTNRIQYGSGGNGSIVCEDRKSMLIKASGYSFIDDKEEAFAYADLDGRPIGHKKTSSEGVLHGFLYRKFSDIRAIIHVHAPYAVAFSAEHESLPRITKQAMLKMATDTPIIDVKGMNVSTLDFKLIEEVLDNCKGVKAFILKDHGIVAMGKDPIEAEHLVELVEETAMIAMLRGI